MFTQLIERSFPARQADHSETDAKIAALEKEVAELKALLKEQSQRPLTPVEEKKKTQTAPISPQPVVSAQAKRSSSAEAAYFDKETPRSAPTEEEIRDHEIVMQQSLGPFFPKDGPVLIHSLGSWEQDVEEAQRRMDLFFSTADAFRFARRGKQCKGSFSGTFSYDYTFWSEAYFHSHDGWDSRGESATVIRISPVEFYRPSDPREADQRILAMCGEQDKRVTLNFWGETTFDRFWAVPQELAKLEGDRYYLSYDRFREKDFLGMAGYYEIRFESY